MKKWSKVFWFAFTATLPLNACFEFSASFTDPKDNTPWLVSLNQNKFYSQYFHFDESMKEIYSGPEREDMFLSCWQDCMSYVVYEPNDVNDNVIEWNYEGNELVKTAFYGLTEFEKDRLDLNYFPDFDTDYWWVFLARDLDPDTNGWVADFDINRWNNCSFDFFFLIYQAKNNRLIIIDE